MGRQMHNIVHGQPNGNDRGHGLGDTELPAHKHHDRGNVGNDENDGEDGIDGHDEILRGYKHNEESESDTDAHTLEGALVKRIFALHEAPVVLSVLEHVLKPWWGRLIKLAQEALPIVIHGQLIPSRISNVSKSLCLNLHHDQLARFLIKAQLLRSDILLTFHCLKSELFQVHVELHLVF